MEGLIIDTNIWVVVLAVSACVLTVQPTAATETCTVDDVTPGTFQQLKTQYSDYAAVECTDVNILAINAYSVSSSKDFEDCKTDCNNRADCKMTYADYEAEGHVCATFSTICTTLHSNLVEIDKIAVKNCQAAADPADDTDADDTPADDTDADDTPADDPAAPAAPTDVLFNCARPGQTCANEGTCTDGVCACVGDYAGFACTDDVTGKTVDESCTTCKNGGTCYSDNAGVETCVCTSDYHGTTCDTDRVQAVCDDVRLAVTVTPVPGFGGVVFVGSDSTDTTCQLTAEVEGSEELKLDFSLKDDCGGSSTTDDVTGDTSYIKQLRVHFNKLFHTHNDLLYNLSCLHSSQSKMVVEFDDADEVDDPSQQAPDKTVEQVFAPARLTVRTYPELQPFTDPVYLGQRVYLLNYLDNDDVFKALSVQACTATDDKDKVLTMVDGGCPTVKAAGIFFSDAAKTVEPLGVKHDIMIFKLLPTSKSLTFTCVVTMCKQANIGDCDLPNCGGSEADRRKRRSASDSSDIVLHRKQVTKFTVYFADTPTLKADTEDTHVLTGDYPMSGSTPLEMNAMLLVSVVSAVLSGVCLTWF